jgi:hypothetical protein
VKSDYKIGVKNKIQVCVSCSVPDDFSPDQTFIFLPKITFKPDEIKVNNHVFLVFITLFRRKKVKYVNFSGFRWIYAP